MRSALSLSPVASSVAVELTVVSVLTRVAALASAGVRLSSVVCAASWAAPIDASRSVAWPAIPLTALSTLEALLDADDTLSYNPDMPDDTVAVLVARLVSSLPAPDSPDAALVTVDADELTATACAAACADDWLSCPFTESRLAIEDASTA